MERKKDDLIQILREIVVDNEASDADRSQAVKKLMRYDKPFAIEKLELFIEQRRTWAVDLGILLLEQATEHNRKSLIKNFKL